MGPARERVRIATWNCFGAPTCADEFFAGTPFWPQRLESPTVTAALADFDVVCIQENLVDRVRESLERLQRAAGFAELWFDPMGPDLDDGTFVGGGLAILSRFPLRARFARLPRGMGPDSFARKGLAIAEVRLPSGRALHVINTHLQADDANVSAADARDARAAQLEELAEIVGPLLRTGEPTILCGDLNVAHGTDEYDAMRAALGRDLLDLAARAGLTSYDIERNDLAARFHPGGPERALLDYILASPARLAPIDVATFLDEPLADVADCPPSYAARPFSSDHFAVGATFELT